MGGAERSAGAKLTALPYCLLLSPRSNVWLLECPTNPGCAGRESAPVPTMTYRIFEGEILPRDPPRPPRCEALMHFSATQSPRQPKSPRTPRSLPAMDPATARSPRRVGAPVSGRPWSPGAVDSQGQWSPVVAEEFSAARQRAVPTSRAEAAALHDELLERLSAEPRLSYADQMRLLDFGMAEAARQARRHVLMFTARHPECMAPLRRSRLGYRPGGQGGELRCR